MGEAVEKVYCCDRDNNDNALAAAILANGNNRRDDSWPMAAALMNNGGWNQNQWMNNPFAYLMFLALFRNGGFGGDGAGTATQGIETQAQLNAIRTQLQDNQNADCIKSAIQGNGFALSQLAQTLNIDFNTLQKCCCDVQAQQDKCDILRAGQDNTQRIIDTLNNHWKDEQALKIQDLKFELSQERQNNYFARLINGGCSCGGNSCGCGCGQ